MSNELIYGIHAVNAVLQRDPARFVEAYVLKGRQDDRLLAGTQRIDASWRLNSRDEPQSAG